MTRRSLALGLLSATLVACDGGTVTCESMEEGLARDKCWHNEVLALPGTDADGVLQRASQISDAMIRQAAVSAWVGEHANEVNSQQGEALCNLLDGRDRSYCQRQLSSPHLQR